KVSRSLARSFRLPAFSSPIFVTSPPTRGCPMSNLLTSDSETTSAADTLRNTYWAKVSRVFWRSIFARIAVVWIILIFLLTIFAPLSASSAPSTAEIRDASGVWHREYPLFRDLTRVDLIWLVWGFAIALYAFLHWLIRRTVRELGDIRVYRAFVLLILGSV